jgi:hypothetical protein
MRYSLGLPLLVSMCAHAAAGFWDGRYVVEEGIGNTVGGSHMFVEYVVTLACGASPPCAIGMGGFQTDEELLCTAHEVGSKLILAFKSHSGGNPANTHGVSVYDAGSPLWAFEWLEGTQKRILRTTWQTLGTMDGKPQPPGVYVEKDIPRSKIAACPSVVHEGISYSSHGAEVTARQLSTNKVLWAAKLPVPLYKSAYNPALEEDAQWNLVCVKQVGAAEVMVTDGLNHRFAMDRQSGKFRRVDAD